MCLISKWSRQSHFHTSYCSMSKWEKIMKAIFCKYDIWSYGNVWLSKKNYWEKSTHIETDGDVIETLNFNCLMSCLQKRKLISHLDFKNRNQNFANSNNIFRPSHCGKNPNTHLAHHQRERILSGKIKHLIIFHVCLIFFSVARTHL